MAEDKQIEIYQSDDGQTQIQVRLEKDTIWLSQAQMAELFEKDSDTIGLYLRNIYNSDELERSATTEDSSVVRQEGKRQVRRKIKFYNLDAIISVGYRVNSKKGTRFRIWATQRLKEYLVKGYSINQQRFEQNAVELQHAMALIRKAAQSPALATDMGRGLVDILSRYTQTFLWLQQYDEGLLEEPNGHTGGRLVPPEEAMASLVELSAVPKTLNCQNKLIHKVFYFNWVAGGFSPPAPTPPHKRCDMKSLIILLIRESACHTVGSFLPRHASLVTVLYEARGTRKP